MLSVPLNNLELTSTQSRGASRLARSKAAALFWDVGVGKTLTTLVALEDIAAERVLIVGPRQVVENTWPAEIDKWGFEWEYGIGTRTKARLENAHQSAMALVNYENLIKFLDIDKEATWDVVVFDELSKMKSPGTKRFKKVQNNHKRFERVWGLTGSPAANHLLNVWGQVRTITQANVLYRTYTQFKRRQFFPVDKDAFIWKPYEDTEEFIYSRIAGLVDRAERKLDVGLFVNDIEVQLPDAVHRIESALIDDRVWGDVTVANGGVLGNKLIQVASGAVYDENDQAIDVHSKKIERLVDLVDELQGQPIIIFYNYQHELARLKAAFPQAKPLDVDAWNRGEIEVMLLHPGSAGHGLNLQEGGHHIAFMSLPWSMELYEQAIGRVYRTGQQNSVTVHRIMAGFDYKVADSLRDKDITQQRLLENVDAYRAALDDHLA
jgi:SNF2 family DNA or RNA helicase